MDIGRNICFLNWIAFRSSPQSSADLRAIMEQEELRKKIQIDKPKKEGKRLGNDLLEISRNYHCSV